MYVGHFQMGSGEKDHGVAAVSTDEALFATSSADKGEFVRYMSTNTGGVFANNEMQFPSESEIDPHQETLQKYDRIRRPEYETMKD